MTRHLTIGRTLGLLVGLLLQCVCTVALAATPAAKIEGYVHSTSHGQSHEPGQTFHLMLIIADGLLPEATTAGLEKELNQQLRQAGYGSASKDLLRSDVVVVARLGVYPDQPSIDDVLERGANPDAQLSVGQRYLQLEAYDMPDYVAFLRQNENAAEDVNQQFQSWRTTVETRGAINDYAAVLPHLLGIAAEHMGTEMAQVQRFVVTAAGVTLEPASQSS